MGPTSAYTSAQVKGAQVQTVKWLYSSPAGKPHSTRASPDANHQKIEGYESIMPDGPPWRAQA